MDLVLRRVVLVAQKRGITTKDSCCWSLYVLHNSLLIVRISRVEARLNSGGRIFRAMNQQPSREAGMLVRHFC